MLHTDQDKWAQPRDGYGHSGAAPQGALAEIARQIEETQRRQGETLSEVAGRLRALDRGADVAHDDPWDPASAEALMQSYEAAGETSHQTSGSYSAMVGASQDWVTDRFNDVTQRMKRALADLKPGATVALLEERLDQFQRHLASALEDVVRRSDLAGLQLIEGHVDTLGQKLATLEQHVARLNGIEADVRGVMEQVSDERLGRLLDYDTRFAADIEALALRAAEEVHARLPHNDETELDTRRHEELCALIETSIRDRRQADADAASLVSELSGRVDAHAERYDQMKDLLEQAIHEQRQSEQTAYGMLDTLQQGLVSVLDRLDALELQQGHAAPPAFYAEPVLPYEAPAPYSEQPPHVFGARPNPILEEPAAEPLVLPPYEIQDLESPEPVEIPAAFAEAARTVEVETVREEEVGSAVDRLRREFIADARRAKMKAAANRAEQMTDTEEAPRRGPLASLEATRAALTQAARSSAAAATNGGSGRIFGASPKLIAGALALVVAINGALLLLPSKDKTPGVPEITIEQKASPDTVPPGDGSAPGAQPDADVPAPGQRSSLDSDDENTTDLAGRAEKSSRMITPYGLFDDVLDPPASDAGDAETTATPPMGTTVQRTAATVSDDDLANVYQQQVIASLSNKLGAVAAGKSPQELLPESGGRIAAAYTVTEPAPSNANGAMARALDLPPATVGPLSLRLAAANGDASAEFEVAARLAEGKGTAQTFAEAARWYQRSASKGFAQSQYRLGTLYERGLGVTKDLERARVWYTRAAEQGNVKAMHNLAVLTAGAAQGQADFANAMPWFEKAAEHGLADSQYNLAVLFENGLSGQSDKIAALKWYTLAAQGGDADAAARRDTLKRSLAAKDVQTAEEMVVSFKPREAIAIANDARAAGEDWKKRASGNG